MNYEKLKLVPNLQDLVNQYLGLNEYHNLTTYYQEQSKEEKKFTDQILTDYNLAHDKLFLTFNRN